MSTTVSRLATAIPATIGYNRLGASLARAAQELHDLIQAMAQELIVSRTVTNIVKG